MVEEKFVERTFSVGKTAVIVFDGENKSTIRLVKRNSETFISLTKEYGTTSFYYLRRDGPGFFNLGRKEIHVAYAFEAEIDKHISSSKMFDQNADPNERVREVLAAVSTTLHHRVELTVRRKAKLLGEATNTIYIPGAGRDYFTQIEAIKPVICGMEEEQKTIGKEIRTLLDNKMKNFRMMPFPPATDIAEAR